MSKLAARPGVERQPADTALSHRRDPFEEAVQRYMSRVTRIAYRITQNIDDARDVAQFVFLQMFLKSPDLADRRSIDRWLYVVTRNQALSVWSRRQRDNAVVALRSGVEPGQGLEDIVLQNERDRQVRATIARLPPGQRHLIELRHLVSMPTTEIAEQFGIPLRRVKRDVKRAKLRLRIEMLRRGLDKDTH